MAPIFRFRLEARSQVQSLLEFYDVYNALLMIYSQSVRTLPPKLFNVLCIKVTLQFLAAI